MRAVHFDASRLAEGEYALTSAEGLALTFDGDEVLIAAGDSIRGWLRRLAPPQWRRQVKPASHDDAVRSAWIALLVGITRGLRVTWLSDIERLFIAENKIVQQSAAASLGIATPTSAVVSRRELIPPEIGERFIAKPLGTAQFDDAEGKAHVVFTNELTRDSPELDALQGAPFLLQQLIPADRHLRVVTVGDQFWVCGLDAIGLPLDWRSAASAHDSFEVLQKHDGVGNQALALASALGVQYSSQDWIFKGGAFYFLDLNPSGQWLFLPEPVSSEVTAAIAAWLADLKE